MSRYASTTDLASYMGIVGTSQNALLQSCLDRAESQIEQYTRRNFVGTVGTVFYNRFLAKIAPGQALYLDTDLLVATSITNGDGQNIPVGSVWLEPRNASVKRIVRLMSSFVWVFNTDSEIQIAGTFGYSLTCPADIQQATIRYGAYLFRQKDVGITDVSGFADGGEVTYTEGMPKDVRWLLAPYRSRTGGVV